MEEILGIIIIVCLILSWAVFHYLDKWQKKLIKEQSKLIENYENIIKDHDVLFRYCINDIHNKSVLNEDYETAIECKKLLDNLNKTQN